MATLSMYVSIWAGLIIVGFLMGYNLIAGEVMELYRDPVSGMFGLLSRAFTDVKFLILVFGISAVAGGLTSIITGNNFSVLFVIPMAIVFSFVQLFLLPTGIIMAADMAVEIQFVYSVFIGTLTVLTLVAFVGGRQ